VKKNALHFGVRALALVLGIVFVVGRADTNATFRANALAPKICGVAGHAGLKLDGVRVKSITERPAGNLTLSGAPMLTSLPAFCRVEAVVETGSDSLINFEVWLPAISKWNWWSFDFDRDLAHAEVKVGSLVDQVLVNTPLQKSLSLRRLGHSEYKNHLDFLALTGCSVSSLLSLL